MNWGYLHYLLAELDWKGKTFKRIDMMIRQRAIYDRPLMKADLAQLLVTDESLQTTYFPLRELCRKFDGYEEMRIRHDVAPPLTLPPEDNYFSMEPADLIRMMKTPGETIWSLANGFELPAAWVHKMVSLYTTADRRHQARVTACGNATFDMTTYTARPTCQSVRFVRSDLAWRLSGIRVRLCPHASAHVHVCMYVQHVHVHVHVHVRVHVHVHVVRVCASVCMRACV